MTSRRRTTARGRWIERERSADERDELTKQERGVRSRVLQQESLLFMTIHHFPSSLSVPSSKPFIYFISASPLGDFGNVSLYLRFGALLSPPPVTERFICGCPSKFLSDISASFQMIARFSSLSLPLENHFQSRFEGNHDVRYSNRVGLQFQIRNTHTHTLFWSMALYKASLWCRTTFKSWLEITATAGRLYMHHTPNGNFTSPKHLTINLELSTSPFLWKKVKHFQSAPARACAWCLRG